MHSLLLFQRSKITGSFQSTLDDTRISPICQTENKGFKIYSQQYLQFGKFPKSSESCEKNSVPPASNSLEHKKNEHVCDVCSQSFSYKHNLKAHYRLHTGEKPYICRICKREYTFYPSLRNHLLSAHFSVLSKYNDCNQKQQLKMLLSKKR